MTIISKFELKFKGFNSNTKAIVRNATGSLLVRGLAMLVSFMTMPAYMAYFGDKNILGVWFTMLSVLSWILTFDLGIGNGLRNNLVRELVHKNFLNARKYISSAYILIAVVTLCLVAMAAFIFPFVNWNVVFNIEKSVISQKILNVSVVIIFAGVMLRFLLRLITSILYAMQKAALTNLLLLITNVAILIYMVTVSASGDIETDLISLSIVWVLAVNVPLVFATILLFKGSLRDCAPKIRFFELSRAKEVVILGGHFLGAQVLYMILTTSNNFLITWLSSPEMVVIYQIYNRMFMFVATIFGLALVPVWSAVTKAFSEKDYNWLLKLFRKLKLLALLGVLSIFLLIPVLQLVFDYWLGDNTIKVNYFYAITFAILGSIFIWNGVLSCVSNGLGKLKTQIICFFIGVIVQIPLAFFLTGVLHSWIGVVWANIAGMSCYCIVQPILLNKLIKNTINEDIHCSKIRHC